MDTVPQWRLVGDWFDLCSCDIPCPCEFAQPPTNNHCEGVLAWHVREGHYGDVQLHGLNLVALGTFDGNIWTGEAKNSFMGLFFDERADERQREALQAIFGGQAGGWPAGFAALVEELRGIEFVPIQFEVAGDLAFWRVEVPGKVVGRADAAAGAAGADAQPARLRGRPRRRCDLGAGGHESGRGLRLQVRVG